MTESNLPCWSCADEAAGKPRCERWCGLPGKCVSNMPPPAGGFATFKFTEVEAPGHITPFWDFKAMEALLKESGIAYLATRHSYEISIDRADLPKLTHRLERILRAISPYIDFATPGVRACDGAQRQEGGA